MLGYVCLNSVKKKYVFNNIKVIKPSEKERIINLTINDKYDQKKKDKISKKLIKVLKKNNISSVIFEEDILSNLKIVYNNVLNSDFKIINGNYLYEKMLNKIIEYTFENTKKANLEQLNVGLILNILSYDRLEFIKQISKNVKGLTILTDTVSKFSNLSAEILEDTGLSLKVTNNIKSGIKNCNLVINFDYDLSKTIDCNYNNCILLNFNNKFTKPKRNFKGIIVNDINVNIEENEIFKYIDINKFRNIALVQSINDNPRDLNINYLIGTKDKIQIKELNNFEITKVENKKRK